MTKNIQINIYMHFTVLYISTYIILWHTFY